MTTTIVDPVCGMNVRPERAAAQSEYQGKTFYFCCKDCKRVFDADPSNYATEETAEYAAVK